MEKKDISKPYQPKQRTGRQNNSIHLYLSWVSRELNNQGQTLQDIVKKINKVEIRPTPKNIKEVVWHEIQKAVCYKESSASLTKNEVDQVYEVMSAWLAKHFQIDLPFPSETDINHESDAKNMANKLRQQDSYPQYQEPSF